MYYMHGVSDCGFGLGNLVKCIHMGFLMSNSKARRLTGSVGFCALTARVFSLYPSPHANLKLMVAEFYFPFACTALPVHFALRQNPATLKIAQEMIAKTF